MTTSTDRIHQDDDVMMLQAQIRGLENETRTMRETLRDQFAAAALQGLLAYYGDRCSIVDADSRISLHAVAYDHADLMIEARSPAPKTQNTERG